MFRILNGVNVDLPMLARNAGTSLQMLERFYLSRALPAMKVANLHGLKPVDLSRFDQTVPIQIRVSLAEPETEPFGA